MISPKQPILYLICLLLKYHTNVFSHPDIGFLCHKKLLHDSPLAQNTLIKQSTVGKTYLTDPLSGFSRNSALLQKSGRLHILIVDLLGMEQIKP